MKRCFGAHLKMWILGTDVIVLGSPIPRSGDMLIFGLGSTAHPMKMYSHRQKHSNVSAQTRACLRKCRLPRFYHFWFCHSFFSLKSKAIFISCRSHLPYGTKDEACSNSTCPILAFTNSQAVPVDIRLPGGTANLKLQPTFQCALDHPI